MKTGNYILFRGGSILGLVLCLFMVIPGTAQSLQEENKRIARETNKLLRSAEDNLADNDFSAAGHSYRPLPLPYSFFVP